MDRMDIFPAFDGNSVSIVLASSDYYAPYAGVFLRSLLDCAGREHVYDVIIFEREISAYNKRLLNGIAGERKNVSLRFYDPTDFLTRTDVHSLGTKQFPLELYFRVLAPFMLTQYDRIITVDVDTLLQNDIAGLYDVSLDGACMAAVPDILWQGFYNGNYVFAVNQLPARDYFDRILQMKDPMNYVNCGVVVYDCAGYRKELNWETILARAKSRAFMWQDQCTINGLLEGKIKFLDYAWNVELAVNSRSEYAIRSAPEESRQLYEKALRSPNILHWTGRPKSWVCPDVPYGDVWWKTAMQTPFMGHVIARMFDALQERRAYFQDKYGQDLAVWEPNPEIDRYFG